MANPKEEMDSVDIKKIADDFQETASRTKLPAAVIGCTTILKPLVDSLGADLRARIEAVFDDNPSVAPPAPLSIRPFSRLAEKEFGILLVAANRSKERFLEAAAPYVRGHPKIIVSGYGHYDFQDQTFHKILSSLEVPSLANGYPNTLPHLYQCLCNASRLQLEGVVAEFGAFRGGTTMFLARAIKALGEDWPIFAFDTFAGFPEKRDVWDLYDHEDLKINDIDKVRQYLAGENVELVEGDIVETAKVLRGKPAVLSFMDTDNYSPAMAALDVVQETTLVGGAIVFDHYTGASRFRYTLGERRAAKRLVDDPRYFNLHGTGVFYRQR